MIERLKAAWRRHRFRKHHAFWGMLRACAGPGWKLDDNDYPLDPMCTSRAALFSPEGDWVASFEFSPTTGLQVRYSDGESASLIERTYKDPDVMAACIALDLVVSKHYDRRYRQALEGALVEPTA